MRKAGSNEEVTTVVKDRVDVLAAGQAGAEGDVDFLWEALAVLV
jgi:hypothetical protein